MGPAVVVFMMATMIVIGVVGRIDIDPDIKVDIVLAVLGSIRRDMA